LNRNIEPRPDRRNCATYRNAGFAAPYVRRVAVSLQLLGLPFEHRSISVFSAFDRFREINPVVKAPSLVCDDGTVLMDSTLILEYAESLAAPGKSLMPASISGRQYALRVIGLALAACEKSLQIIYERNLRPTEKFHQPWVSRVTGQLLAAYGALESELVRKPLPIVDEPIDQAGVTAAVTWHFTQMMLPEVIRAADFPALQRFSATAEGLAEFAAAPHGAGICRHTG
jgi:glutathione S-transferase